MSPVSAAIVAKGAIVGAKNGTHDNTMGVTKDVTSVEIFRLAIVLTELTIVPDDKALSARGLHNSRRLHILMLLGQ